VAQADWRREQLFVGDEVDVEVGVGEAGVDEGVRIRPCGVGAHLATIPAGEMNDFIFGKFGEFAAHGLFRNIVEGGDSAGTDASGMTARSGEAEKFAAKSSCGSHGGHLRLIRISKGSNLPGLAIQIGSRSLGSFRLCFGARRVYRREGQKESAYLGAKGGEAAPVPEG
jgi:hypothetical protein